MPLACEMTLLASVFLGGPPGAAGYHRHQPPIAQCRQRGGQRGRGGQVLVTAPRHLLAASPPDASGNSSSLCFAAAAERPTIAESSGIEQQQQQHGALRRRSLLLLGLFAAGSPCAAAAKLSPGSPVATSEVSEVNDLALKAINAYRARELPEALDLFNRIIAAEPENSVWYERRGQVLVDLDRFKDAIADFDKAEALQADNYISLGLLSNRALAYEGIYNFEAAEKEYSRCLELSQELGLTGPYILNARGNARGSLGRWEEALEDYRVATEVFQKSRNLQGAIFASANASLALIALGRREQGVKEMEAVSRRAPGSVDMRAALAAIYWSRGDEERAEETWRVACDKINSGQLVEGGSVYDGCERYRDRDWLIRIRRWPPVMVDMMMDFVSLKAPPKPPL